MSETFKVGDRVRAIETDPGNHITKGNTYVLTRVQSSLCPEGPLLFGDPGLIGAFASRFEKVEPVPFKLERGDKVVNRKTGREGFVIMSWVYDEKPPFGQPVHVVEIEKYEEQYPGTYDLIKKDAPW